LKFRIPLRDYERIFKTIYSILKSEEADIEHSCVYASIFGAHIIRSHYKLEAKVHAGIAAYKLGAGDDDVMVYAERKEGEVFCSDAGFHCWVEVNGWLIDFMAPLFPDMIKRLRKELVLKPLMMQKRLDKSKKSIGDLVEVGDFFLETDINKTHEIIDNFSEKRANSDLMEICENWYKKPPKKMIKKLPISDGKGYTNEVSLIGRSLEGVW